MSMLTKVRRPVRACISTLLALALAVCASRTGGDPAAAALSPGDILIADPTTKTLWRVDPTTGGQTPVSSNGFFVAPHNVAIEASGQVLVIDLNAIIRVDPVTGTQSVVSADGLFVGGLFGVAIEADGSILVSDVDGGSTGGSCFIGACGTVIRVSPSTGLQTLLSADGNLFQPMGLAVAPNGDIYAIDNQDLGSSGGGSLVRIDPVTGAQTVVSSGGFFTSPSAVAMDANGQLVVIDTNISPPPQGPGGVIRVDPGTGTQSIVSDAGHFKGPRGVAIATNGDIYVGDPEAFGGPGASFGSIR